MRIKSPIFRLEHAAKRIELYNEILDSHASGNAEVSAKLTDDVIYAIKSKIYTLQKRVNALERKLAWRNFG